MPVALAVSLPLEVDGAPNRMDCLVHARVVHPLAAWSGTPRTQYRKRDNRYVQRWEPDRSVTQLIVAGLGAPAVRLLGALVQISAVEIASDLR